MARAANAYASDGQQTLTAALVSDQAEAEAEYERMVIARREESTRNARVRTSLLDRYLRAGTDKSACAAEDLRQRRCRQCSEVAIEFEEQEPLHLAPPLAPTLNICRPVPSSRAQRLRECVRRARGVGRTKSACERA